MEREIVKIGEGSGLGVESETDKKREREVEWGKRQSEQPAELGAFMMLSRFLDSVPVGLSLSPLTLCPFPSHEKRGRVSWQGN